jgi:hypothetical protein
MNTIRTKSRNLYFFLAVACFISIILIFLFDGYMGLYETLTMTSGEQTQTIAPEQWINFEKNDFPAQLYVNTAGTVSFSYQVDNRRFSGYKADIDISLWQNQQKIRDVLSQSIDVQAFKQETVTWEIDIQAGLPSNPVDGAYTLEIKQGDIKRDIVFYIPAPNNSKNGLPTITVKNPAP